jgi:hypothetical protein
LESLLDRGFELRKKRAKGFEGVPSYQGLVIELVGIAP